MNPAAILALISELYGQLQAATGKVQALEAERDALAEQLRQQASDEAAPPR